MNVFSIELVLCKLKKAWQDVGQKPNGCIQISLNKIKLIDRYSENIINNMCDFQLKSI